MSKSLYSLILSDNVIAAVDREALKRGLNRSSFINEVLAEVVDIETPEQQMRNLFSELDKMLGGCFEELLPSNSRSMALRTSLDYRYKPTVKYELEISKSQEENVGVLKVQWRTTSEELTFRIDEFIRYWMAVESKHNKFVISYEYEDNKFQRTFTLPPDVEFSISYLSNAIGKYIKIFDIAFKKYATGELNGYDDVEKFYTDYEVTLEMIM